MRRLLPVFMLGTVLASGDFLPADTVFLKNGSWIDGIVKARDADRVLVEIGNIGTLEIRLEDIYEIEKNSRSGGEILVPVDGRKLDVNVRPVEAKGSRTKGGSDAAQGAPPGRKPGAVAPPEAPEEPDEEPREEASASDADPALKERIAALTKDLVRQQSRYRVRAERLLKAIGPPAIPDLLLLAKHESDLVRVSVFRLFNAFGDERVIDACIDALLDPNEFVRDNAHRALTRITHEDFGFQPLANPRRREHDQQKWRRWWREEKALAEELSEKAKRADASADAKTESVEHKKNK
jgi:hypothetical protein